jgi:hypothetical protein
MAKLLAGSSALQVKRAKTFWVESFNLRGLTRLDATDFSARSLMLPLVSFERIYQHVSRKND